MNVYDCDKCNHNKDKDKPKSFYSVCYLGDKFEEKEIVSGVQETTTNKTIQS
jgi:hypothetical protein